MLGHGRDGRNIETGMLVRSCLIRGEEGESNAGEEEEEEEGTILQTHEKGNLNQFKLINLIEI